METEPLLHLPISIMNVALLGKKIGMTQVFDDNNRLVPVTVISRTLPGNADKVLRNRRIQRRADRISSTKRASPLQSSFRPC